MSEKRILNTTARSYNIKPVCKKKGKFNVALIPGVNIIDADLYKLVKAMPYCKGLVEDGILDFNPKKVKKNTPVSNAQTREVKDPTEPLGSGGGDKKNDPPEDDGSEDEEYQAYLKECAEDEEDDDEPMTYAEWLEAE